MSHEGEVRLLPILDEPENFAFVVGLPIMRNDEPVAELAPALRMALIISLSTPINDARR